MSDHSSGTLDPSSTGVKGQDPSMEDILASIRQIIADEPEAQSASNASDKEAVDSPAGNDDLYNLILNTEDKPEPVEELSIPRFGAPIAEDNSISDGEAVEPVDVDPSAVSVSDDILDGAELKIENPEVDAKNISEVTASAINEEDDILAALNNDIDLIIGEDAFDPTELSEASVTSERPELSDIDASDIDVSEVDLSSTQADNTDNILDLMNVVNAEPDDLGVATLNLDAETQNVESDININMVPLSLGEGEPQTDMEDILALIPDDISDEPTVAESLEHDAQLNTDVTSDSELSRPLSSDADMDMLKSLIADLLEDENNESLRPKSQVEVLVASEDLPDDLTSSADEKAQANAADNIAHIDEVLSQPLSDDADIEEESEALDIAAQTGLKALAAQAEADAETLETMGLEQEAESGALETIVEEHLEPEVPLFDRQEEDSTEAIKLEIDAVIAQQKSEEDAQNKVADDQQLEAQQVSENIELDETTEGSSDEDVSDEDVPVEDVPVDMEKAIEKSEGSDIVTPTHIAEITDVEADKLELEDLKQQEAEGREVGLDNTAPEANMNPKETQTMPKTATAQSDTILDEVTETAAADAFAALNEAVEEHAEFQISGPRIGEIVQDALRPMLKEWLDENLKSIVERAVTKEVRRISSGK